MHHLFRDLKIAPTEYASKKLKTLALRSSFLLVWRAGVFSDKGV
jgi:hypothetical protein